MSSIRLVVFDIGGVLVRVLPWDQGHLACGLPPERLPRPDAFLPEMSMLNHAYDGGLLSTDAFERAAVELAGGRYTAGEVRLIHAALIAEESPGMAAVFDALEGAGVVTGLLSNTNPSHWSRLAGLVEGPPEYPTLLRATHRHASFALRCSKPDPRIYAEFNRLTATGPAEILFFDDLERNVQGAREAGWSAVRIDPLADPAAQAGRALLEFGVLPGPRRTR